MPTAATVSYITAHVPRAASLIEVGCGEGHVALALAERGYRVRAIDPDPEVVAKARERGVPATLATWPDFDADSVDAVVFSRSLHHIHDLEPAVRRARELLRPDGLLLVEDFAYDEIDQATVDWFLEVIRSERAKSLLNPHEDEFIADLLSAPRPLSTWQENHDHDLHSLPAMADAITRQFERLTTVSAPYLFRYLVPALPESEAAAALVEEVRRSEAKHGQQGDIVLIGRRIVATPSPSESLTIL